MMEKIDVHRAAEKYEAALARFATDESVSGVNRALIQDFLRDCALGKTLFRRQKKRILEKRLLKYLGALRAISRWLGGKDFRLVTQAEMEAFIRRLEANALPGPDGRPRAYAAWTRRDFKVCLRKFYKWLLGGGRELPGLVSWIDTTIEKGTPPSLSLDEVRRCVDRASFPRGKALVWTLFETGARAEEFLNIRLGHVEERGSHFAVRIEHPKTFKRTLPVFEGAEYLRAWLREHPAAHDPSAQLFPLAYSGLRAFLARLGERALGRPVRPHLLRDSFATWLATKRVGRYQMCKVMGWAMSSDMPDRYIDRTGVVEEETITAIRGDALRSVEEENRELKLALGRLEQERDALNGRAGRAGDVDAFLNALLEDEQVRRVLVDRVVAAGLGERLLQL